MKVRTEWIWRNDPEQRPDLDHSRCIAASGERILDYGPQLFKLTTEPCAYLSESDGGRSAMSFSTLRLEYTGLGWARGSAIRFWGSHPFDSGPFGDDARRAAGVALMSTVAGALDNPGGPKPPVPSLAGSADSFGEFE